MRSGISGRVSAFASLLLLATAIPAFAASAAPDSHTATAARAPAGQHLALQHISMSTNDYRRGGHGSIARRGVGGGLQCVSFARSETGIELSGNAANWWDNAAGIYDRGAAPEPGAILNFRANGRMRLGHVSVVSRVVSGREILIDHANWSSRGGVSRSVSVMDVSPDNDWTAVRVRLGSTGEYGAVYPTYGFIYTRPAGTHTETLMAAAEPMPELNPAPADLRYSYTRTYLRAPLKPHTIQVAMAPAPKHQAAKKPAKN